MGLGRAVAIWAACVSIAVTAPVAAQDVTLISRDGTLEISGELLGFDGDFYRVRSVFGELTVDGTGVRCDGPGCPSLTDFVAEFSISGAPTVGEVLLPALIEAFALRNGYWPDRSESDCGSVIYRLMSRDRTATAAVFRLRLNSAEQGFDDLIAGSADMVMSLREVRQDEVRRARDAGLGDLTDAYRSHVIALDGLVAVTARNGPLEAITLPDLARVIAGEIDNWSLLGGADASVAVHVRDAGSGPWQAVEARLLAPLGLRGGPQLIRHARDSDVVAAVTADPFALGLVTFGTVADARALDLSGGCGFPVRPGRPQIKTEDYPLTNPVFLYLPARRLPQIGREFLRFVRSAPAQMVVRRAGFVDQAMEQIPIAAQGDRLANAIAHAGAGGSLEDLQAMVARLSGLRRLTLSFRFDAGAVRLDAQSRVNVSAIAEKLAQGEFDGRTLVFAGFSDGQGSAVANRAIAARRAEAVVTSVLDAAQDADTSRVDIEIEAFGEALPMACDDSAWGRKINRRVEVWVR